MSEIRLVGESVAPDRQLYVASFSRVDDWPQRLDPLSGPFVLFTAFDATRIAHDELRRFAQALLDQGCVYTCSWGPDSGRVETAFDLFAVDAEIAGNPYANDVWTTSHEDESLDDALWFAVFSTYPEDVEPRAMLAVAEDKWIGEIESRLTDSKRWSARLLDEDEGNGA